MVLPRARIDSLSWQFSVKSDVFAFAVTVVSRSRVLRTDTCVSAVGNYQSGSDAAQSGIRNHSRTGANQLIFRIAFFADSEHYRFARTWQQASCGCRSKRRAVRLRSLRCSTNASACKRTSDRRALSCCCNFSSCRSKQHPPEPTCAPRVASRGDAATRGEFSSGRPKSDVFARTGTSWQLLSKFRVEFSQFVRCGIAGFALVPSWQHWAETPKKKIVFHDPTHEPVRDMQT